MHAYDHWTFVWDTSATHLPTPKVIMENIVRRAVTHVEFNGNFISSDLPVIMDSLLDLLFHCQRCHANWPPIPVFISEVLSSIVKLFPPIHTLSPHPNNCLHTETSFFCGFHKVSQSLTTKKRITFCCLTRCKLTMERPCCMSYCAGS